MNDIYDLFARPEIIQALVTVFAAVIVAALIALASAYGVANIRKLWAAVRGQWPGVISQVDEPTDPAMVLVGKYTPALVPWLVRYLPAFLKALQAELDKATEQPPQETARLDEATK